ncbi:MAG: hypothetical protein J0L77_06445 [Alphaproteobacteria bacterium]|nr:hypothetical protein [Alphaproteobacteria bacterium]
MSGDIAFLSCEFWNEMMPSFFEGFGIVLGIVIGVLINILVNDRVNNSIKNKAKKALVFELNCNLVKIDEFLRELNNYEQKVISGHVEMSKYYGYFKFSDIFSATCIQLYQNGFFAEYLGSQDKMHVMSGLQNAINSLSVSSEQMINNSIESNRVSASKKSELWETETKPKAFNEIQFWRKKLTEGKKSFEDVVKIFN